MHFSILLILPFAGVILASPLPDDVTPAAVAGSKDNVYLVTCAARRDQDSLTAVVYYNKAATSGASPQDVGAVSSPAKAWEGAARKGTLTAGNFEAKIEKGAETLAKSQIAGTGKLGSEDFVCFVDGTSTFRFVDGLLGSGPRTQTQCVANYWCASTDVNNRG